MWGQSDLCFFASPLFFVPNMRKSLCSRSCVRLWAHFRFFCISSAKPRPKRRPTSNYYSIIIQTPPLDVLVSRWFMWQNLRAHRKPVPNRLLAQCSASPHNSLGFNVTRVLGIVRTEGFTVFPANATLSWRPNARTVAPRTDEPHPSPSIS